MIFTPCVRRAGDAARGGRRRRRRDLFSEADEAAAPRAAADGDYSITPAAQLMREVRGAKSVREALPRLRGCAMLRSARTAESLPTRALPLRVAPHAHYYAIFCYERYATL